MIWKLSIWRVCLAGMGVLAAASCSASPPHQPSLSSVSVIDAEDPCTLITKQELQRWDITSQRQPVNDVGEIGCQWSSPTKIVALIKGKEGLDFFDRKAAVFINYARNTVNGRSGARLQGSPTNTECSEVMAVGTGYVSVDVYFKVRQGADANGRYPGDPCGDAMAIATVIEPRLPK